LHRIKSTDLIALQPTLSVVGNLSSTNILILDKENDSQTPVQQAFLLRQRLTDVNHPGHTLRTYPNLGYAFYSSSQWSTGIGPIERYVLAVITPNGTSVSGDGNISKANTTKVNGNTIFHIASITKTFTTSLLADAVKSGLVNLDDPIEKYLPAGVRVPTYNGHKITLENLATHTSGLPVY
jgi:beta-lactamase family protein